MAAGPDRLPASPSRRDLLKQGALGALPLLGWTPRAAGGQPPRPPRPPAGRDYVVEASAALVHRGGVPTVLRDVSVRVRGGDIVEVREGRIGGRVARIDARGQLLLPGFISGHTHAASGTPTRGLIEGGRSYQRPLELLEALPDDLLDDITAYNVAELLRAGCTTHVEMSLSLKQAQSYVRVARRWHVRGYPGGMVPGTARLFPIWRRTTDAPLADSVAGTLAEIEANRVFALAVNGAEEGLIRPMMTPHATDTHTPETMRAVVAAARTLGNGIHIHLAQGAGEARVTQRLYQQTPAQWLESMGAFEGPFFGAHMTGATAVDWEVLKRHGGVYAHCPSGGGAGSSSGTQPYPEALAAGVRCNIGIDTHSNDYVENLKQAVICGRARARLLNASGGRAAGAPAVPPLPLPTIQDAVSGATHVAADGLRRPDLGRIAEGAKADLCTIDVSGVLVGGGAVGPEPLHHLLYANGLSVRHVITQGHVQLFHGELVVDDAARVAARGGAAVEQLWAQLRSEGWFSR
ncbi:MAG: amidohydrolase family protein [Gemmatimonadetes bacterium]|nr:amidohydrolase family protein [Gemmatimonadota bacterium]